jgi:hypothetical protein
MSFYPGHFFTHISHIKPAVLNSFFKVCLLLITALAIAGFGLAETGRILCGLGMLVFQGT